VIESYILVGERRKITVKGEMYYSVQRVEHTRIGPVFTMSPINLGFV